MARIGSAAGNCWGVVDGRFDLVRARLPPRPLTLAARPAPVTIDLAATALVVIDMQSRFCAPDPNRGGRARPTRAPIEPLRRLLPALRRTTVPVVWVNWGTRPDRANLAPGLIRPFDPHGTGRPFLASGSAEAALVPELRPELPDLQVEKHRISGFWDTPLDSILRNLRVTTLLFAGVNLDQCVYATLVDASCLGFDCLLLEDCTATSSPEFCVQATHYNVERCFGFTLSSAALTAALD